MTVLKDRHQWLLDDVAVPDDLNTETTEAWKIEWYQELAIEVKWIHLFFLQKWQEYLSVPDVTGCAQMSALLGNSVYSQKGVAPLSCGRELKCDIVYPAQIKS